MSLILWCLYALFEGHREGSYWYIKNSIFKLGHLFTIDFKEHIMWTIQRSLVLVLVYISSDWITVACCILVFPFMHDGAYYTRRNWINKGIYPKRFFAQSKTSTAIATKYFPPIVRTICAVLGVGLFIFKLM